LLSIFSFEISPKDLVIVYLVALFIGMAKTGVQGIGMIAVLMLANVFGGRLSSGIILPILIAADVMGVWYYHRHTSWYHLKILFPWAAAGVFVGTLIGVYVDDGLFRTIMAIIIIISVVIMIWLERGHKEEVPTNFWFGAVSGVAGGFSSMIGNLAGAIMALYLLSMRLPKNAFIGTAAWFFMVMNWFKVPFHVFIWDTINLNTVLFDLTTIPAILLGGYLGIVIVRQIPEKSYRWFIIIMTLGAAVVMLL